MPCLSNIDKGHPDHRGTKRTALTGWGVSSVGCSFAESRIKHSVLTEGNKTGKETVRKSSAGQSILGKVRHYQGWVVT